MTNIIHVRNRLSKPAGAIIAMPDGKNFMTYCKVFRIQCVRYMITPANRALAVGNDIIHVAAKKVKFQLKNTFRAIVVFLSGTCFFTLTFINDGKII
jgi:predicted transcriptional regulator